MNILYGIQGTGNGHITRSRLLVPSLRKKGFNVDVILSGRKKEEYWDMECFKPYDTKFGITFQLTHGTVKKWETIKKLELKQFWMDLKSIDFKSYDIVITDYEPISAWAAKKNSILSIGIGHLYSFLYNVPMQSGFVIDKKIMNWFAPVDIPIGLHWHHFGQNILPPIIPQLKEQIPNQDFVLVYLPWEDPKLIESVLNKISDKIFYVYGHTSKKKLRGNIKWKPFSRSGFIKDLESCNGVICNAGFELTSECLSLNKKILVKPVMSQVEQLANVKALDSLELASTTNKITNAVVSDWIENDSKSLLPYFNVVDPVVDWIGSGNFDDIYSLRKKVWS